MLILNILSVLLAAISGFREPALMCKRVDAYETALRKSGSLHD